MKRYLIYMLPFLMLGILNGCIKEKARDCFDRGLILHLSYKGDGLSEIFFEKIGLVKIFIYNSDDQLVSQRTIDRAQLTPEANVQINDLPLGQYKVVCWGNPLDKTTFKSINSISSAQVSATEHYEDSQIKTNDSLYFGTHIVNVGNTVSKDTVAFSGAHCKFEVYILGSFDPIAVASAYYIRLNNAPAEYDFTKVLSSINASYFPIEIKDLVSRRYKYTFNTLQMVDDNAISFDLVERATDNVAYSFNLKDYMIHNNISVDGKNEQKIRVVFTISGLTIAVRPWQEEDLQPGTEDNG